jgi:hypothetical protein
MIITTRRFTLALSALALPVLASAQAPAGARGGERVAPRPPMARSLPQADVSRILNARRALDLTPRQVAQLDSIERAQFAARRADQERMRQMRDTLTGNVRQRAASGASRDSLRAQMQARMEAVRPQMEQMRRRDSTARAAAERVLTDPQRQQLRVMQAEARGYQRGIREGRGARGAAPRQGARGERGVRRQPGMPGRQNARPQDPRRPGQRMQRAPRPSAP